MGSKPVLPSSPSPPAVASSARVTDGLEPAGHEGALLYVHDEGFYAANDIELRLGATAVGLDTSARELALDDG